MESEISRRPEAAQAATAMRPLLLLGFLCGTALLCLPFYRSIWWTGDEGIWLDGAYRLLKDQHIYRDFFELHPPGGFLIVAGWMKVFGESILSVRALAAITMALLATMALWACLIVSNRALLSIALVLAWFFYALVYWPVQINHHWFTSLFSLAGFVILISKDEAAPETGARWFLAGLCYGLAVMITPTRGVYAATAALPLLFYAKQPVWALAEFVLGCAIVPVALVVWVIASGSIRNAFEDTVIFPFFQYSAVQRVTFGNGSEWLALLYPLTFGSCIVSLALARGRLNMRRFVGCIALAAAGLLGCFPRPDAVHILQTFSLALPLLALSLAAIAASQPKLIAQAVVAAACLVTLYAASRYYRLVKNVRDDGVYVESPRGRLSYTDQDAVPPFDELARLPADARVGFYPYIPILPFLADREGALRIDVFVPQYNTAEQYHQACQDLMRGADYFVWERSWADPNFLKKMFPFMTNPSPREKLTLEGAVETGFDVVFQRGDYQIWKRNARAAESLCHAGIS